MMMRTVSAFIHVIMLATYGFTWYASIYMLHIPMLSVRFKNFDPGQLKYLTVWNVIVQAVFFFICILNDFYGTNAVNPKKAPVMRKIKDYFHAAFSFPLAMFVGLTFWGLWMVDRELILPRVLDAYFPWWLNHLMHTMIMVSTVIEIFIAPRKYPKRSHGLGGLVTFMLVYLVWMHVVYIKSGVWVYPVMDVLPLPLRILFFLVLLGFTVGLYFAGEAFNNLVWGNEQTKQRKSYSKSK